MTPQLGTFEERQGRKGREGRRGARFRRRKAGVVLLDEVERSLPCAASAFLAAVSMSRCNRPSLAPLLSSWRSAAYRDEAHGVVQQVGVDGRVSQRPYFNRHAPAANRRE